MSRVLALCILIGVLVFVGCGDSESFVVTTPNNQTGNLQVQFDRNNVFAQTTQSVQNGFANANQYAVSILDSNNNLVVPSTFVPADLTQNRQTIVITGIPRGSYTIVTTAFLNGQPTGQVFAQNVLVSEGNTTLVGTGTGVSVQIYSGGFVPTPPTTTTTTGGTTTGGTTTGGTTTGGTTTGGTTTGGTTTGGTTTGGTTTGGYGTTGGYTTGGYTTGGYTTGGYTTGGYNR